MKGGKSIEIKIIGSNSRNGIKLKKEVKKAIEDIMGKVSFIELNDEHSKRRYGIRNIPALIIDGDIKCEGKVLTSREISKIVLNSYS